MTNNQNKEKKKDRWLQFFLWCGSTIITLIVTFIAGTFYTNNISLENKLERLNNNCDSTVTYLRNKLKDVEGIYYDKLDKIQKQIKEKDTAYNALSKRFSDLLPDYIKNAEELGKISKQMKKLTEERDSLEAERDSLFAKLGEKKDSIVIIPDSTDVFDTLNFIRIQNVRIIPIEKTPRIIFNPNKFPSAKKVKYLDVTFDIVDIFGEGKYNKEKKRFSIYVTYTDYRRAHTKNSSNTIEIQGKKINYFDEISFEYEGSRITGKIEIRLEQGFVKDDQQIVFYTDKGEVGKGSIKFIE